MENRGGGSVCVRGGQRGETGSAGETDTGVALKKKECEERGK